MQATIAVQNVFHRMCFTSVVLARFLSDQHKPSFLSPNPKFPQFLRLRKASAMSSTDRDALVALLHATGGGATWARKDNWDTDADLSLWYGVEVDDEGRVVTLRLKDNNLRGNLGPCPQRFLALTQCVSVPKRFAEEKRSFYASVQVFSFNSRRLPWGSFARSARSLAVLSYPLALVKADQCLSVEVFRLLYPLQYTRAIRGTFTIAFFPGVSCGALCVGRSWPLIISSPSRSAARVVSFSILHFRPSLAAGAGTPHYCVQLCVTIMKRSPGF